MDVDGRLLATYDEVNEPGHLSVDIEGRVLVADYYNDRILLLSRQLELERVIIDKTSSQGKLWRPSRLSYNQLTSQLYIAHSSREVVSSLLPNTVSVFGLH